VKLHPICLALLAASLIVLAPATRILAGTVVDLSTEHVPTLIGVAVDEQFGYAGDSADIDGDGETELVVGAPGRPSADAPVPPGAVYVFGMGLVMALDAPAEAPAAAAAVIAGVTPGERFGETVLVADVSADSVPDLIVGAPSWGLGEQVATGRVYVFLGPLDASSSISASGADVTIEGEAPGDHFGASLASGDVDGDGTTDLLASAFRAGPPDAPGAGSVYVMTAGALCSADRPARAADVASSVITGSARGDALRGIAVAGASADRGAFVALGSYHADGPAPGSADVGSVAIVAGAALASTARRTVGECDASVVLGPRPRGFLGRSIAAGDIDDDGISDLLISAYASRGENSKADASGEVFVIFGGAGGFPDTLDLASGDVRSFRSRHRWDLLGLPVLLADLSGDGASDIVFAAQFADSPGGERPRCGEVYVYRGGLRSVVAAKTGRPDLADTIVVGEASQDALGGCLFVAAAEGRRLDLVIGAPDAGRPGAERSGKLHVITAELLARR
jgi:hypothetical protein